jgi:hypothetical protein
MQIQPLGQLIRARRPSEVGEQGEEIRARRLREHVAGSDRNVHHSNALCVLW